MPDLSKARQSFERATGVSAAFGGRHAGMGTHNAIVPLGGETYVELIAPDPDAANPGAPRPFGLDDLDAPRLVTWAVRSRAIEADVELARANGFDPGIVLAMTREEPDGHVLRWRLTLRSEPACGGLIPFVIDWGNARHPTASVADGEHRGELTRFTGQHPDPAAVREDLTALGCALEVERASRPGLRAVIAGPGGSITLA